MKILKNVTSITIVLLASIFLLASCSNTPSTESVPDISKPVADSSSVGAASSVPDGNKNQLEPDASEFVIDPSKEPPLSDEDWAIAVPDFLTEEQQMLYRRAYRFYECFRKESAGIDDFPAIDGATLDTTNAQCIEVEGKKYYESIGRYNDWESFSSVIDSVFTPELVNKLNMIDDMGMAYIEVDNVLYYQDISFMSDDQLEKNYEFFLKTSTGNKIEFQLLAHYSNYQYALDGVVNNVVSEGGEFTKTFDMEMVRDKSGRWRFSQFEVPF